VNPIIRFFLGDKSCMAPSCLRDLMTLKNVFMTEMKYFGDKLSVISIINHAYLGLGVTLTFP